MTTSTVSAFVYEPLALAVSFPDDERFVVTLADGRELSVPLIWFPRLYHASAEERADYELMGKGDGIHWTRIDEDLSVAGLLRGTH